MIFEAILLIAIVATGFIVILDKMMYPRHSRLFRGKPKLVLFSQAVLPALVIILLLRSFTFEAFRIPSASMKPTLMEGDFVLVDKYSHGLRVPVLGYRLTPGAPKRGDVVVFRGEVEGESAGVIKRIVGLPGDHIKYQNRTLYVNNVPASQLNISADLEVLPNGVEQRVIRATEDLSGKQHDIFMAWQNDDPEFPFAEIVVPQNNYFVLGDHRSNSRDSRFWGVLPDNKLVGKARLIVLSVDWAHKKVRWQRLGKIN